MTDFTRRQALLLGLGTVSTLLVGSSGRALAAVGDTQKPADGVVLKTLSEGKSTIAGFSKVQFREMTFQPGAVFDVHPMSNDMVCYMKEGTLSIDKGTEQFVAKKGTLWTCAKGSSEGAKNTGKSIAVMGITDLLA